MGAVRASAFWLAILGVDILCYESGIGRGGEPLTSWPDSPGICPFQLGEGGDEKCWQPKGRRGTDKL